jgi:hypothetical protein
MPEGRAERAVEAPAKSIDGAEHSGMMQGVTAVVQIDSQKSAARPAMAMPGVDRDHRSDLATECHSDRHPDHRQYHGADPLTITAPRSPLSDAQAVV